MDIVELLRENADLDAAEHVPAEVVQMQINAANEIERLRKWHIEIAGMAADYDEDGATAPRAPMSWESVARLAIDYSREALKTPHAIVIYGCDLDTICTDGMEQLTINAEKLAEALKTPNAEITGG